HVANGLRDAPVLSWLSDVLLFTNLVLMTCSAFAQGGGKYSIDYGGWQFIMQNVLGLLTMTAATYYGYKGFSKLTL
ncbi:MAG: hypothetical protein HRS57_02105, partial [Mycoplasmataceae bacterium]|nr:hypothetical protein [Mycoplasmataceae bacterium]